MTLIVLDTDTLSLFQSGDAAVIDRCRLTPREDLHVTVISVEEVLSGWYTLLRRAKTRARLAGVYQRLAASVQFLGSLSVLTFSERAIERFEQLKASKLGIRAPDLRIAAIALEHGGTLVTRNLRDFRLIPGLAIEDWSKT